MTTNIQSALTTIHSITCPIDSINTLSLSLSHSLGSMCPAHAATLSDRWCVPEWDSTIPSQIQLQKCTKPGPVGQSGQCTNTNYISFFSAWVFFKGLFPRFYPIYYKSGIFLLNILSYILYCFLSLFPILFIMEHKSVCWVICFK